MHPPAWAKYESTRIRAGALFSCVKNPALIGVTNNEKF